MESKPRVVNFKVESALYNVEKHAYVGRPSKWGNPFKIGRDGTREEVIAKYREWLLNNSELKRSLHELRGKDLFCYCAPLPCHADVLLELANKESELLC